VSKIFFYHTRIKFISSRRRVIYRTSFPHYLRSWNKTLGVIAIFSLLCQREMAECKKKKEIYAVDQHKTPASSCSAVVSETVIFILSSRMNITR